MLMPTVKEFIRIFSYGSVAYNKERPLTKTNSRAGGAFVLLYNRIPRGIPGGRPKGTTTRYEICRPSEHGPYGRTDIIILFPFFRSGLLRQAFLRFHIIGTTIFTEVAPRRPLRDTKYAGRPSTAPTAERISQYCSPFFRSGLLKQAFLRFHSIGTTSMRGWPSKERPSRRKNTTIE